MQIENKFVSIIIGTYNREHLVQRAINSVLNQSHRELELFVVDDASEKNIHKFIDNFKDERLVYLRHSENRGISAVCNTAFSKSKGNFIALLGDDDEWIDEYKLEKQLAVFESDKDSQLGISGTWWIEDNGVEKKVKSPKEPYNWPERLLMAGGIICGSTALIRREAWIKVGGFDEKQKRGTDSDIFRRIILSGYKASILDEITTLVDIGHGNLRMTPKENLKSIETAINARKYKIEKLWNEYQMYPKALSHNFKKMGIMYARKNMYALNYNNLKKMNHYLLRSYRQNPGDFTILIRLVQFHAYYVLKKFHKLLITGKKLPK